MPVYKVSMPVTLTVEIEANHAPSIEHVLRKVFDQKEPRDPMEGVKVRLPPHMPFAVSDELQVMTCTLDPLDDIEISEA